MNRFFLMLLALFIVTPLARAQSPAPSKVDMTFNKWYTYDECLKWHGFELPV